MHLTITGYSTALFSTWYFIEEAGMLLDCGDGVTSALLQKSRKASHIFISHADRDHLTGLLQMNQLNARPGFPQVYYPRDSGSFPALQAFSARFDPHVSGTQWIPAAAGQEIHLKDNLIVLPVRNNHVPAEASVIKSLGYKLISTKRKLRPEWATLSGIEIGKLRREKGEDHVTDEVRSILMAYSGDTPVENAVAWDGAEVLIHEATFIDVLPEDSFRPRANKHSRLEEVIAMTSTITLGKLVLGHFSSRYENGYILRKVQEPFPVYVVLPGITVRDILKTEPVYQP
jgi:ribonuclease Z